MYEVSPPFLENDILESSSNFVPHCSKRTMQSFKWLVNEIKKHSVFSPPFVKNPEFLDRYGLFWLNIVPDDYFRKSYWKPRK